MAKEKAILSDLKVNDKILINGMKHVFKGYEKRRTNFGRQEMFVFENVEDKIADGVTKERLFERFNFGRSGIKKIKANEYEWS